MANNDTATQVTTAGLAFGDLIKLTGKAVADTQQVLNKTAAESTSALATTRVDVVAVQKTNTTTTARSSPQQQTTKRRSP